MPPLRVLSVKDVRDYAFLKKKAALVSSGSQITKMCDDLYETMLENKGIGIAATQCGILLSVAVIDKKYAPWAYEDDLYGTIVNPKIVRRFGGSVPSTEGCLSVPGMPHMPVMRDYGISVNFEDHRWKKHELKLTGENAAVFLHEFDHLDGKTLYDHLPVWKKKSYKLK